MRWWTGTIIALLSLLIALLAWQFPRLTSGSSSHSSGPAATPESQSPGPAVTLQSQLPGPSVAPQSSGGGINGSLVNADSQTCLDDTGYSNSAGTQMQIWQCSGNSNQNWTTNSDGTIRNDYSDLCLDVQANALYDLAPAIQSECNSNDPSEHMKLVWTSFANQSDGYEIINDNGMCLDDEYANTLNGNPVEWFQCNYTIAQDWYPG